MSLKEAVPADLPDILTMMQRFHALNGPPWALDLDAASLTILGLMDSPQGFVAVGGGFIAGVIQANPIAPDWLIAKEFLWWSEGREGMRLLRAFRSWAEAQGASEIQMSCPVGSRAEKAFQRFGTPQEVIYSEIQYVL